MRISLFEPTVSKYIYVNPETNVVHVFVPIEPGEEVSLENGCNDLTNDFFSPNQYDNNKGQFGLKELRHYRDALINDIQLLDPRDTRRDSKQKRLDQVNQYIFLILNKYYFSNKDYKGTNLERVTLAQTKWIRTIQVPRYEGSLQTRGEDIMEESPLLTAFKAFLPQIALAPTQRTTLKNDVRNAYRTKVSGERSQERIDSEEALNRIKVLLNVHTKERFGVDIDFEHDSKGQIINLNYFTTLYFTSHYLYLGDCIEGLLNCCAADLWTTLPVRSHYQSIDDYTKDKEVRMWHLTHFLIAHAGMYSKTHQLSQTNFKEVLDNNKDLSTKLVIAILNQFTFEGNVEEQIIAFINKHLHEFGLSRPLTEEESKAIISAFNRTYSIMLSWRSNAWEISHFKLLNKDFRPHTFVSFKGSICLNLVDMMSEECDKYMDPKMLADVKRDFASLPVDVPANHEWLKETVEVTEAQLIQNTTDAIFEELPSPIKQACKRIPEYNVHQFSLSVARSQRGKTQKLLRNSDKLTLQDLLIQTDPFTDNAMRKFNCSGFEYAYWARDYRTCRILEKYMDNDTKALMHARMVDIEQNGLAYEQNGIMYRSSHYDLKTLKSAFQKAIDSYQLLSSDEKKGPDFFKSNTNLYAKAHRKAVEEIGLVQKQVPDHVVHEYCNPKRNFNTTPAFDEKDIPENTSFYDCRSHNTEFWYPSHELPRTFSVGMQGMLVVHKEEIPKATLEQELLTITQLEAKITAQMQEVYESFSAYASSSPTP